MTVTEQRTAIHSQPTLPTSVAPGERKGCGSLPQTTRPSRPEDRLRVERAGGHASIEHPHCGLASPLVITSTPR